MRRSRNALAAALVALATLGCGESPVDPSELSAQTAPQGTAEGAGRRGLLGHAEELGLTDAQVQQIGGILDELEATNAPLLAQLRPANGARPEREQARELLGQIRDHTRAAHEEILALLTDAQRAQLRELGPRRGGEGRGGPGRGGREGGGFGRGFGGGGVGMALLRLREQLELTDAQVTQLRTIAEELRAQNEPLIDRLRQGGERPQPDDPTLQEIRANVEAASERMLAVLTAAQRAELDELRQRMEERGGGRRRGPRGGQRGV